MVLGRLLMTETDSDTETNVHEARGDGIELMAQYRVTSEVGRDSIPALGQVSSVGGMFAKPDCHLACARSSWSTLRMIRKSVGGVPMEDPRASPCILLVSCQATGQGSGLFPSSTAEDLWVCEVRVWEGASAMRMKTRAINEPERQSQRITSYHTQHISLQHAIVVIRDVCRPTRKRRNIAKPE